MKDLKYIVIFGGLGLVLAYFVSAPLRRPPQSMPRVGTPLEAMGGSTVATSKQSAPANALVYASGEITLGSKLSPTMAASRTLFIMAKASVEGHPAGGPPVAVERISTPSFPFSFSLTTANNMMGSDFYSGDIMVIARLDKDGMAGPKQPEDFESNVLIKAGQSRHVSVEINP